MQRIAFVGGPRPIPFNCVWGGAQATNRAYERAFSGGLEYELDPIYRDEVRDFNDIERHFRDADITHVDDSRMLGMMFKAGMDPPDVIGPLARSAVKTYKDGWEKPYSEDWFYRAKVIRLNYSEERKHKDLVTLITHGVDTELLQPRPEPVSPRVLWAGQMKRPAKNYDLWLSVRALLKRDRLRGGSLVRCCTMSNFAVQDYWKALETTSVVVCTSKYESFCCAAFEAMACNVPVVWRTGLQGGIWEDAGIRVDYTPEAFVEGIHRALAGDYESPRQYVLDHCTLRHMRDSYVAAFEGGQDA